MIRPVPIIATSIIGGVLAYYAVIVALASLQQDRLFPWWWVLGERPNFATIALLAALIGWTFWARSVWRKWRAGW